MSGLTQVLAKIKPVVCAHGNVRLLLIVAIEIAEPHYDMAVGQLLPALEKRLYVLAGSAGEAVFVRKPIYDALRVQREWQFQAGREQGKSGPVLQPRVVSSVRLDNRSLMTVTAQGRRFRAARVSMRHAGHTNRVPLHGVILVRSCQLLPFGLPFFESLLVLVVRQIVEGQPGKAHVVDGPLSECNRVGGVGIELVAGCVVEP